MARTARKPLFSQLLVWASCLGSASYVGVGCVGDLSTTEGSGRRGSVLDGNELDAGDGMQGSPDGATGGSVEDGGAGEEPTDPGSVVEADDPFEIDLGAVSGATSFDIPDGALGFHLLLGDDYVIALDSPSGARLVSNYVPLGWEIEALFFGVPVSSEMLAMASGSPVVPGRWSVTTAYGGMPGKVRGVRTSDGRFHGGVMNLYIHVPDGLRIEDPSPATTVDAATAAQNEAVSARVDAFYRLLSKLVGIDRGQVTFVPAAAELADIGSQAELDQAFTVGGAAPDHGVGLHMLFVHSMALGAAAGFAPAMPSSMDPRGMNTIVMNITQATPIAAGGALLHELGHLAGLHHTTDVDGSGTGVTGHDPLTDTAECHPPARLAECPDITNVMFPMLMTLEDDLALTEHQRAVIRGAPIYRAYSSDPSGEPRAAARRQPIRAPTILEAPLLIHH